jgi:hypothetical protein
MVCVFVALSEGSSTETTLAWGLAAGALRLSIRPPIRSICHPDVACLLAVLGSIGGACFQNCGHGKDDGADNLERNSDHFQEIHE